MPGLGSDRDASRLHEAGVRREVPARSNSSSSDRRVNEPGEGERVRRWSARKTQRDPTQARGARPPGSGPRTASANGASLEPQSRGTATFSSTGSGVASVRGRPRAGPRRQERCWTSNRARLVAPCEGCAGRAATIRVLIVHAGLRPRQGKSDGDDGDPSVVSQIRSGFPRPRRRRLERLARIDGGVVRGGVCPGWRCRSACADAARVPAATLAAAA